jgi:hypothetical protein
MLSGLRGPLPKQNGTTDTNLEGNFSERFEVRPERQHGSSNQQNHITNEDSSAKDRCVDGWGGDFLRLGVFKLLPKFITHVIKVKLRGPMSASEIYRLSDRYRSAKF